jgi:Fe-S-cluster-containing hydrogenase component 2
MSKADGVLSIDDVKSCPGWPGDDVIEKKRVAVLECVEDIPCNPCEIDCPNGAITVGTPITNLPRIDGSKCNGCFLCIARCPGLSIFVVEKNYSTNRSTVSLPYELLPLPSRGDGVKALDRRGEYVCDATVVQVLNAKKYDRTKIITIEIAKEYVDEVRSIKLCHSE